MKISLGSYGAAGQLHQRFRQCRLSKLELRLGIAGTAPSYLIILNDRELAHTDDAGIYITGSLALRLG
jgi:hypothetical protein